MSATVDGSFAEQERSSLQPLAPTLSSLVAQPLPSTRDWPPSAFSAVERADAVSRISVAQQNAVATVNAFARDARDADEAGRKAAAWGIVTTVTAAVIVAIVAVITSVFTFGAALYQVAAVLSGQATALGIAAASGYPFAAELAAILSAMADSLRGFVGAPEQARHESTLRLCTDIEQSLTRVGRLPSRAGTIAGAWRGDREAAFDACRALDLVLGGCVAMLERVPPTHMDTRPAVRQVITLREAVATAVRTLATRP